ncbi:granulocyte-macrophage colony-stimulating factor receptor subunit alpha-like [Ammospiza nelsoni]|uniref:granulocyte-macrophage colony-stimulating factor receptor subunit alpha-like n=1 Tax=Ammospiza nelsoni TaxID=2857394 RepID=UPI002869C8F9|nr:granulocyte-macrophage colony-stimulating factor receptor subunit alpha-like [Ammospiza nelsoni]
MKGSAIENFSCVIYNIFLMNCTWQAGRDAPADTQYFLYWQQSRGEEEMECELYIKDENFRNVGCIFQNVSIGIEKAYFLVNGSSNNSLIQFYDEYIDLYKIVEITYRTLYPGVNELRHVQHTLGMAAVLESILRCHCFCSKISLKMSNWFWYCAKRLNRKGFVLEEETEL